MKKVNKKQKELQIFITTLNLPINVTRRKMHTIWQKHYHMWLCLRELFSASTFFLCLGPTIFKDLEKGWRRDWECKWKGKSKKILKVCCSSNFLFFIFYSRLSKNICLKVLYMEESFRLVLVLFYWMVVL